MRRLGNWIKWKYFAKEKSYAQTSWYNQKYAYEVHSAKFAAKKIITLDGYLRSSDT